MSCTENFSHNFGHGKQHLSALLASLIILAFLTHALLGWLDECYQLLRKALSRRQTFFDDIRALTRYAYFDSWQSLLEFMLRGLKIPIPESWRPKLRIAGTQSTLFCRVSAPYD